VLEARTVTSRHAAAVALIGWYLMLPPFYKQGVDSNAPPSRWKERAAFDTAAACEEAQAKLAKCGAVLNGAGRGVSVLDACGWPGQARPVKDRDQDALIGQVATQYMESRCVATDDPRLKVK
jgi:hypothetical protein